MKLSTLLGNEEDCQGLQHRLWRLVPQQTQDIIATGILLIFLPLWYFLHFFVILPTWYPAFGEAWVIRAVPYAFFIFNVYINWSFMVYHGPNGRNTVLPNVVTPGFKFCHHCQTNAPPRSHHCPVCNVCILKRDHHNSFGGVCVGHFNHRYFIAAILHFWLISLIFLSYSISFVSLQLEGGITVGRLWQIFIPHVAFAFRFLTLHQFVCVLMMAFNMTILAFATYLVSAQAFCLWRGQTRVEYLMDIHAFNLGLLENIRQTCGSRWFLIAISPVIPSPLPSNGLSFHSKEYAREATKSL